MSHSEALDFRELSSYKPLFLDYLHQFDSISPFFSADPFEPDSWHQLAGEIEKKEHPRIAVASALDKLNRSLGGDEAVLASVEALREGALAVVTGQQVGLFGGPLYTLYKALSAVALAQRAQELLGRKVVPLFWMDADDHDFEEVRHASLIDREHEVSELVYEASDAEERLPVGGRVLESSIETLLEELARTLPESEFREEVLSALRDCYAPGRTMAQAFGSWLLRMSRGSGLALVDPTLPELKSQAVGLFDREISEGSLSSKRVTKTTEELLSRGYHAQATPTDGHLNLFYSNPYRFPLVQADSGLRLSANGDVHRVEEVRRMVRDEPELFSPNVLLRPIYQDTLLPTLAYVAGPNELAYFAQLGDVYHHFDVTMPLVASRMSFTVVERPQARFLERYHVDLPKLGTDDESLLNEIVREHTPPQLDEDLTRARTCIQEITEALERDLRKVDETLVPTVQSTRGKLLHHLKDLEAKSLRAVKRRNDTVTRQFFATRTALFPDFVMQERKLSPVGYVSRYGWYFSKMVSDAVDPTVKAHLLLYT